MTCRRTCFVSVLLAIVLFPVVAKAQVSTTAVSGPATPPSAIGSPAFVGSQLLTLPPGINANLEISPLSSAPPPFVFVGGPELAPITSIPAPTISINVSDQGFESSQAEVISSTVIAPSITQFTSYSQSRSGFSLFSAQRSVVSSEGKVGDAVNPPMSEIKYVLENTLSR